MNEAPSTTTQPSIHVRRRWYYALWISLLVLSVLALYLWEKPSRVDHAKVELCVNILEMPEGTKIDLWKGPEATWPGMKWQGNKDGTPIRPDLKGWILPPIQEIPIARRRWVKDFIHRLTPDLLVLRFAPSQGPARYMWFRLAPDIHAGALGPRRRLIYRVEASWQKLCLDPESPPPSR
jgi:hypothetical protein